MNIRQLINLREDLGAPGIASLGLLAAGLLFLVFTLKPLEARNAQLQSQLAALPKSGPSSDPSAKLSNFYAFFDKQEDATDWLAKLDAMAKSAGVEMSSGRYQMQDTGTPLARYELTLPLAGSYPQIRAFLEAALAQIPVLSVDQLSFRRKNASETQVQADVRLSLYMVQASRSAPAVARNEVTR